MGGTSSLFATATPTPNAVPISDGSGTLDAWVEGIPAGIIAMWSGTLASIPAGWILCDGTNGTPDLRDRFIMGWSASVDPGGTGGTLQHAHGATGLTFTGDAVAAASTTATPDLVTLDVLATGVSPVTTATGAIGGSTANNVSGDALPPYFKLAYLMKV